MKKTKNILIIFFNILMAFSLYAIVDTLLIKSDNFVITKIDYKFVGMKDTVDVINKIHIYEPQYFFAMLLKKDDVGLIVEIPQSYWFAHHTGDIVKVYYHRLLLTDNLYVVNYN